jgi:hypothetical protein
MGRAVVQPHRVGREDRQGFMQMFQFAANDPTANIRYGLRYMGKLNGMEKDQIERLFPPTVDERIADDENKLLSDNQFVGVLSEDDHNVHLEKHAEAAATDSTYVHIETHKKALTLKKTNPELFPAQPQETTFQPQEIGTMKTLGSPAKTPPVAPSQTGGAMGAM